MKLYHFCCLHSAVDIARTQVLRPWPQPLFDDLPLIWLTDLDNPSRDDVGLTSQILRCDRMKWRVTVEADSPRWIDYARNLGRKQRQMARVLAEQAGAPAHWYVSELVLPIAQIERRI